MAQTTTSIAPLSPSRSGLVRLYGTNLGSSATHRLFLAQTDGSRDTARTALYLPVANWQSDYIEFYIPEAAKLGSSMLFMLTPTGKTYMGNVNVQARMAGTGPVKWRFQAADQYIITRPALGPDGTIYAIGNFGHLYALTPDGGLKWVWSNGADGTVDVGPDGTVYCAGGGGIQAFSPDGTRKWQTDLNSVIMAGPSVGPDGNIYAADNSRWSANPTGAVVLNPSGQKLWSGGVFFERGGSHQTEVQFDQNRAYIWSFGDANSGAIGGLHSIRLGGGLDWMNTDVVGFQPSAYASGGIVAQGTSTTQRMSTNGNVQWSFDLWSIGGAQPHGDVLAAPNGGAYFFTKNARLNALNPNGSLRFSKAISGVYGQLTLSPDGNILMLQRADNFGLPSRIEAYSANTGALLWTGPDLPLENGTFVSVYNRMKFAPDGKTLFFGTVGPYTSATTAHCYVYAMNLP